MDGAGRHTGAVEGIPPTGREVTLLGIEVIRGADDRIVERWGEFDVYGLLRQLGALPAGATE